MSYTWIILVPCFTPCFWFLLCSCIRCTMRWKRYVTFSILSWILLIFWLEIQVKTISCIAIFLCILIISIFSDKIMHVIIHFSLTHVSIVWWESCHVYPFSMAENIRNCPNLIKTLTNCFSNWLELVTFQRV